MSIYRITHDGDCHSLKVWAEMLGVPYRTAQYRWHNGIRDFEHLFGKEYPLRSLNIREQDLEWLRETRHARKGMKDEWKIACELLGISKHRAGELRKLVEGRI